MSCLPESLRQRRYYLPTEEGYEQELKKRLEQVFQWKKEKK